MPASIESDTSSQSSLLPQEARRCLCIPWHRFIPFKGDVNLQFYNSLPILIGVEVSFFMMPLILESTQGINAPTEWDGYTARMFMYTLSVICLIVLNGMALHNKHCGGQTQTRNHKDHIAFSTMALSVIAGTASLSCELSFTLICALSSIPECSFWGYACRAMALLHLALVLIFIALNKYIPRKRVGEVLMVAHVTATIIFGLTWTVIKELMHVKHKIDHPHVKIIRGYDFTLTYDGLALRSTRIDWLSFFDALTGTFYALIFEYLMVALVLSLSVIYDAAETDAARRVVHRHQSFFQQMKVIVIILPTAIFFEVLLVLLEKLGKEHRDMNIWIVIYYSGIIPLILIGIVVALMLFFKDAFLKKLGYGRNEPPRISSETEFKISHHLDNWLFYIGYSLMSVYGMASFVNSIRNISFDPTCIVILDFIVTILSLVQAVAQAAVIIVTKKLHGRWGLWNARILSAVNLMLFLIDLGDAGELGTNAIPGRKETNLIWFQIVRSLCAVCIFFRFHSACLFMETAEHCAVEIELGETEAPGLQEEIEGNGTNQEMVPSTSDQDSRTLDRD